MSEMRLVVVVMVVVVQRGYEEGGDLAHCTFVDFCPAVRQVEHSGPLERQRWGCSDGGDQANKVRVSFVVTSHLLLTEARLPGGRAGAVASIAAVTLEVRYVLLQVDQRVSLRGRIIWRCAVGGIFVQLFIETRTTVVNRGYMMPTREPYLAYSGRQKLRPMLVHPLYTLYNMMLHQRILTARSRYPHVSAAGPRS